MEILDQLICLLRNLYAGQGARVEPDMEQLTDWFQIGERSPKKKQEKKKKKRWRKKIEEAK